MSYQAFINSLPPPYEPKPGERVLLLYYHPNNAVKGVNHEVRLVARKDQLFGFSIFFGSKKDCVRYIERHGLQCDDLGDRTDLGDVEHLLFSEGGPLDQSPPVLPDLKKWTGSPRFHLTKE